MIYSGKCCLPLFKGPKGNPYLLVSTNLEITSSTKELPNFRIHSEVKCFTEDKSKYLSQAWKINALRGSPGCSVGKDSKFYILWKMNKIYYSAWGWWGSTNVMFTVFGWNNMVLEAPTTGVTHKYFIHCLLRMENHLRKWKGIDWISLAYKHKRSCSENVLE